MITVYPTAGSPVTAPSFHEANELAGYPSVSVTCDGCQIVFINGKLTHEKGCPEAWRDWKRRCKWCDEPFWPTEKNQGCCDDECQQAYLG